MTLDPFSEWPRLTFHSDFEQLGGGCELALMCDIILASPTAVFGQPEINLGVIPGGGGTQRLARTVGKSRAMELTLTGRNFSAVEAERWGVVSRIVEPVDGKQKVVDEAIGMGKLIASKGQISVQAGKEAINAGRLRDKNTTFGSYLIVPSSI